MLLIGTHNIIIGEIINVNENLFMDFIKIGGIYLIRKPIPSSGTVIDVTIFGRWNFNLNPINSTNSDFFLPKPSESQRPSDFLFLYVMTYRPSQDGTVYKIVHGPAQVDHGALSSGRLPFDQSQSLNWEVQKGDLLGVYIPRECVNGSSLQCPSQVNFKTEGCLSAYYHPGLNGVDDIPINEFQEVSVQLSIETLLSPGKQ